MTDLLEEFRLLKLEMKRLEKREIELKDAIKQNFPIAGKYDGFVLKWGRQDRRKVDPKMVTALAIKKNAPEEYFERVLIQENLPALIETGLVSPAELEACLVGPITQYPQVSIAPVESESSPS